MELSIRHSHLPNNQAELIQRIVKTGKPVIVVLMGGKPYAIPEINETTNAILSTFWASEQTSIAISNILFGKVNPSSILSVSFPRSVSQLPVYYSQKATTFYNNYQESTLKPLYPFGHALSYTSFKTINLNIDNDTITKDEILKFSLTIKNTGKLAGAEVVQVYFSDKSASVTRSE